MQSENTQTINASTRAYRVMNSLGHGSNHVALSLFVLLLSTSVSHGQTASLALSSGSALAGGTATLSLALSSPTGSNPAGLQWTFSYPSASVTSFSVTPDSALTSSGKSINCAGGANSFICVATGLNTNVIPNGSVAVVTVGLAPSASSITIGVSGALGASTMGNAIPISATGGSISVAAPVLISALACNPTRSEEHTSEL